MKWPVVDREGIEQENFVFELKGRQKLKLGKEAQSF
jgi:hypothetical protein